MASKYVSIIGARIFLVLMALLAGFLPATTLGARSSADVSAVFNQSALAKGGTAAIAIVVDVHRGLHVQSHTPLDPSLIKFDVVVDPVDALTFGQVQYPTPEVKQYAALGTLSVYTDRFIVYVPIQVAPGAADGPVTIAGHLVMQACNDNTCFPPEKPTFQVGTNIAATAISVPTTQPDIFANYDAKAGASSTAATQPTTAPAAMTPISVDNGDTQVSLFGLSLNLREHSAALALGIAFCAGIIFNIVPCVLPVLPVKAVGFYEASQHNRARTILLGFVFSLGLIAVFVVLGMLVLLSKQLFGQQISWGQQFSHGWFVWPLAIVLAILGVGMLGGFSLQLPTSIYGLDFRHDTLSGNFLWGGLTAVLSTPCTAPLFPPVLAYALTLPRWEGFAIVIMVGVGMASPYFLLSAFPEVARRFPRTGAMAELVKQMMGFLMLGVAAFFAGQRLVSDPNQWWVVFAVIVLAGIYLVYRSGQLFHTPRAVGISAAVALLVVGSSLLVVLRLTRPTPVQWTPFSEMAIRDVRDNHIVLVDFTANWCLNCKYVEQTVYRDDRTVAALKRLGVVTLKADLTDTNAPGWKLYNELGITGIPYTAIYQPNNDKPVGLASIYTTETLLNQLSPK